MTSEMTGRRPMAALALELRGSTRFYEVLSPESLFEIVRQCFALGEAVMQDHGGQVCQITANSLLAGFPDGEGRAAERAVGASREIITRVSDWAGQWQERFGVRICASVGIHLGAVVAGDLAAGQARIRAMVGEPASVAQFLVRRARPDEFVLSEAVFAALGAAPEDIRPLPQTVSLGESPLMPMYFCSPVHAPDYRLHVSEQWQPRMAQPAV
ncbi:MAG: adenylate/guanylate cyclase domain-containing protein [Betaproteobacteria bacterium]|nr:adenylate/guanylate cyclase domain-containing protein [Betaproteobacteria bacterium]